ncbi:hypothetical protein RI129_009220 [Pyrocoelia pectoralis]|uniref:Tower domain-containing protein n=1 Tax=Pyrocoelia pectoralis TaxID=417401 RepID=A0AAN7VCZ1_9COLE
METDKDKQERPLSPILNNSHTFRRKTLTRKKSKTRINLSERFKSQENCSSGNDFKFKIPISPASKLKPHVVGFSTASGKSLHVPSDVIKERYEVYKHILQANYNDDTLVLFRKDFSLVNASKSDAEVSRVVDSNESNVRVLAENVSNLNSGGNEMKGFTVVECDNADDLMSRFDQFLNGKDDGEPPAKKIKLESENEYEILDDTLCNVFAKEDFSLMVSLSKENKGSGARKQLEFISEDEATSTVCDTPVQEDTLEKDIQRLSNEIGSNLSAETASEEALNQNKNCLVDELIVSVHKSGNSTDQLLPGVSGFRTASGETIEISAETLKKSEKLFGDDLNVVGEATMPADELTDVGAKNDSKLPVESLKRSEKLFGDDFHAVTKKEGLDPLVSFEERGLGFTTAAGGAIQISSEALKRSEKLFGGDFHAVAKKEVGDSLVSFQEKGLGFTTAAGGAIQISSEALKRSEKLFGDDFHAVTKKERGDSFEKKGLGFTTAAGGTIQISSKALQRSEQLFGDDFHAVTKKEGRDSLVSFEEKGLGFATAAGGAIQISSEALKRSEKLFGDDFHAVAKKEGGDSSVSFQEKGLGFTTAAGGAIQISSEALKRSKKLFGDDFHAVTKKERGDSFEKKGLGFTTAAGGTIQISSKALQRSEQLFGDDFHAVTKKEGRDSLVSFEEKGLGFATAAGGAIQISSEALKRSEKLFGNDFHAVTEKEGGDCLAPFEEAELGFTTAAGGIIKISEKALKRSEAILADHLWCSPEKQLPLEMPGFSTASGGTIKISEEALRRSEHLLADALPSESKEKLEYLCAGFTTATGGMIKISEEARRKKSQNNSRRRQVLGVLSEKRASGKRLTLKEALAGRRPGDRIANNSITLQNAELVHFTLEAPEIPPVVYTQDGAVIIPNLQNLIGLSEVQVAFEAMIGVDRKLIPIGWIRNHYRLIVWKLASFDRNFPDTFGDCLTVENVLQQLKYRYDREIDKAQRSALHRILEKDDVPQKRMVLCVSNIFTEGNGVEIELSDGWYCIRTIIDDPLKFQVKVSKIVIGTKLVVQSAEILNCDGCHPLEIPELVRLKINYNCTRRAVWYAKLGFQKDVRPFPVSVTTLHYDGGGVGCIRIHIFRVYPICYLEKCENGKSVWRNRKAEDRRVQEWENERLKELELINRRVSDEFEEELKNADNYRKVNYTRLSDVKSTEMLCQMLEVCNDPEDLKESLSSSQLESVAQFQQEIVHQRHQEMSSRMSKAVNSLKHNKRQVNSVLKTKVVDRIKESTRTFMFNIWNPTEEHLQLLKEGSSFYVYNITLKANGDLASTKKTYFTPDNSPFPEMETYQRRFRPISSLQRHSSRPLINEYDTVGLVVQVNKQPTNQEIWLTDNDLNLLHIKIYHGSDTCCLLDSVIRGQSVALLNVVYCEPRLTFSVGIANQCSVVTSFPHQKFLQSNLEAHVEQLPKDLSIFLEDCDKKIHLAKIEQEKGMQSSISGSHLSSLIETTGFDDSFEDSTLIPSGLTSTDVAMSLIDTDQYFETV